MKPWIKHNVHLSVTTEFITDALEETDDALLANNYLMHSVYSLNNIKLIMYNHHFLTVLDVIFVPVLQ